ncbi:plasmid mobilization relaxosome protein MobC [Nocardia sp. 348MFTsu5.1]|uniref:plasmid mobilization relaxosome protein MobC n=1 Tax=Nocardia sp. 348MFTsu5.1 TaxID=1172185 RepID=UPI0012DD59F4|nr:plasmid mobilization relaxosome protein MobC [Nocardia sp. 348MFTsu5.1]
MAEEAQSPPKLPSRRRFRRKNVVGGRSISHKVMVSPGEESMLAARASAARVTIPRLLVEAALAPRGETSTQRADLAAAMFASYRMLASLANNINQIAKATNSTREVQPDTDAALAAVRRAAFRLERTLEGFEVR